MEAQLSLIGGTMGLFSGFSIISGIEIVFFLAKLFYKNAVQCKRRYLDSANSNNGRQNFDDEDVNEDDDLSVT